MRSRRAPIPAVPAVRRIAAGLLPSLPVQAAAALQRISARLDGRAELRRPPGGTVLALVAHPDDETLAFGGTLAAMSALGGRVVVACATDGEATWAVGSGREPVGQRRRRELAVACGWLGVGEIVCWRLADGRLARMTAQLSARLQALIDRLEPTAILLPWFLDGHPDHRALSAALVGLRASESTQVWAGEIWSPVPANGIVDISGAAIARKRAALAAYTTARRTLQLDTILGLNRYRAFTALRDSDAAEAFLVAALPRYRWLVRSTTSTA